MKYITKKNLLRLAEELSSVYRVLAPVAQGGTVTFRRFQPGMTLDMHSRMAAVSAKMATLPQTESLLLVQRVEENKKPELTETLPQGKTLVMGARPCDARGKLLLDPVFITEKIRDQHFIHRRENSIFITLACDQPETTCFCHSVGSGPADTAGSDILLTLVGEGYVAQAISDQGQEIVTHSFFEDAQDRGQQAQAKHGHALELMGQAHDYSSAPAKILERFDDMDFWEVQSAKCVSCGACTYMCPTCYCFNITDNDLGLISQRIRTWDNCMSHTFTLEASGHNPRPTKAHRLKNRVGHKFSYYPDLYGGIMACCGCGRCIKQCPTGVDIRQIVNAAQEYAQ